MPQNNQLRTFCNEKARVMFDIGESTYETARRFRSEYDSAGIANLLSDLNNTDTITDGSTTDGRKPLSVRELKGLYALAGALITWYETTTFNTVSVLDIIRSASVNGNSRF